MTLKYTFIILTATLTLAGCANSDVYSDEVYTSAQAKQVQSVSYGKVVSLRDVKIQANDQTSGVIGGVGGGVVGGVLGSTIGGGKGKILSSAVGAIAGSIAGKKVEDKVSQTKAVEMEIRKENGEHIIVVQKMSDTPFKIGERVRLIGDRNNMTVAPY